MFFKCTGGKHHYFRRVRVAFLSLVGFLTVVSSDVFVLPEQDFRSVRPLDSGLNQTLQISK